MPDALVEAIRPVWILLVVVGCFWAAVWSVIAPPSWRFVTTVFLAGVCGAVAGQALADAATIQDVMIGDAHLILASAGSLVAVVVVRRLVA